MKTPNTTVWYKNRTVRTILVVVAVIAILALVLFNDQIGQLFEFFGSKADIIQTPGNITLTEGVSDPTNYPLDSGSPVLRDVQIEDNRIVLTPPSN